MAKSINMSALCCHVIVCMNIYFSVLQKWLQMAYGTDHGKGGVFAVELCRIACHTGRNAYYKV